MNIALIAHDEKKELMVQFCIAYCGVLSRNNLCATGTTGKMVSEATGLTIQKFLAGSQICKAKIIKLFENISPVKVASFKTVDTHLGSCNV